MYADRLELYALGVFVLLGIALMLWILWHLLRETQPPRAADVRPGLPTPPRL